MEENWEGEDLEDIDLENALDEFTELTNIIPSNKDGEQIGSGLGEVLQLIQKELTELESKLDSVERLVGDRNNGTKGWSIEEITYNKEGELHLDLKIDVESKDTSENND